MDVLKFSRIELIYQFSKEFWGGEKYGSAILHPNGNVYFVPINAKQIMKYSNDKVSFFGDVKYNDFGYTGAVYYEKDNCIYGCPRNSNCLLKINVETETTEEIPLDLPKTTGIHRGHHYSGVLSGNTLYIPPRHSDCILAINLDTYDVKKIISELLVNQFYNGAIKHSNSKIYFTTHKGCKLGILDTKTEKVSFINPKLPDKTMFFFGTCGNDENIYSIGQGGILKINTLNDTYEIVCPKTVDNRPLLNSAFGTIQHPNGKMYNIVSNNDIIEYDPVKNEARVVGSFNDGRYKNAQFCGGVILPDNNILLSPLDSRFLAKYVFDY